jgi:hypothetical protein
MTGLRGVGDAVMRRARGEGMERGRKRKGRVRTVGA